MATIHFYFDFISPYSYLAFHALRRMVAVHPSAPTIHYYPVLFAGLLNHWGQKGPAEIPPKRTWLMKDIARKALASNIPLGFPKTHPFNPLRPLRLCFATPEAQREKLIEGLFNAAWGVPFGRDLSDADDLRCVLEGLVGSTSASQMLARIEEKEVKEMLQHGTDKAIQAGVFGVPTFIIGDELLFGFDQIEFVSDILKGRDPLAKEDIKSILERALNDMPRGADRASVKR
ncbi:hypothetical protein HK104_008266 [Borealophlyctis nickersoniae]|nr:hypothetical protein HK104_008266 [Borealophlyctis nickersoniae]